MEKFEALIERLPDCLHWSPDGEIRVVGRRISLFDILKSLEELGESPEKIAENYELSPDLFTRSSPSPASIGRKSIRTWRTTGPSWNASMRNTRQALPNSGSAS